MGIMTHSLKVEVLTMNPGSSFNIKLSAPGKVILFGEYSVVFKKPAIAASLSLRTNLHIYSTNSDSVELDLPHLNFSKSFPLKDIREYLKVAPANSWDAYLLSLAKAFECLYEKACGDCSSVTDPQKFASVAFFHCFGKTLNSCGGFRLRIDTELPVGAGVGSSASFSTVLSASALLLENLGGITDLIERRDNGQIAISEKFNDQISELAFSCEKIFHGSPSGVDNSTVLHGSLLEFIRSDDGNNQITYINTCPLKILLVNTNIPRSTKKLVANVKQLREDHPDIIECVLKGMENVAKSAVKDLIEFKENEERNAQVEAHFEDLITLNHNLLRVLGVSHPALEQIVSMANKHNLKAKLTGAGGGGFALIYVPNRVDTSVVKTVEKELISAGFTVYDVSLGGPGLTIEELLV